MSRNVRVVARWAGILVAVVALALPASTLITSGASKHDELISINGKLETSLLSQAVIVSDVDAAKRIARFDSFGRAFDVAVADALSMAGPVSVDRRMLEAQSRAANAWRVLALRAIVDPSSVTRAQAVRRQELMNDFERANATLRSFHVAARDEVAADRRKATIALILMFAALAAAAGGTALTRRLRERAARLAEERRVLLDDRRHRLEQEEFTRALQGARTEREAQRMLKRQLERSLDRGCATVFSRNNSADRLEAVTTVPASSPLADAVPDAEPGDCLAVRFGQPFERAADSSPLLACELCGALPGSVTCVPSLVSGEVIGSVLVESPEPLGEDERRRLADGVAHASPVLASMRNLRLAETRAATDLLTGLANRRSAESTFKLVLANANRNLSNCAVVLMDLDHFKNVNDVHGHEKGDQLLAAVGGLLSSGVRASDLVARFGGEEFLVVLSNTDLDSALGVCEKLRQSIADLQVLGAGRGVSASFGVAMFPDDAAEMEGLLRGADRALYAAKAAGRNCVRALQHLEAPSQSDRESDLTISLVEPADAGSETT